MLQIQIINDYVKRGIMLPVSWLNHKGVYPLIKKSGKYNIPSLDDLKKLVIQLEISEEELFISTNPFSPLVYIHELTYVDIASCDKNYLEMFNIKKIIHEQTKEIDTLRQNGNYETILFLTNNKYVLHVFHDVYDEAPVEQKYNLFRTTYIKMEYGFQMFKQDVLEEVLHLNMDASFREKLNVDNEGYVTIYRGEGSKSRGVEEAHSWTTNKKVAQFFARRFDENGKVYKAKIHIDAVIDFIDDRNEDEVILLPENVKNIMIS